MYHEATWSSRSYYDTFEEMPQTAKVTFPEDNGVPAHTEEMTAVEIVALDEQGWYTILHSCNYGCCDHWTSEKPSKWVSERFNKVYRFVNDKKETIGYNRDSWSLTLTRDSKYWKSEVWNS